MARFLRELPKGERYYDRTTHRSVIGELALLLRQRTQGELDQLLEDPQDKPNVGGKKKKTKPAPEVLPVETRKRRLREILEGAGTSTCKRARMHSLESLAQSLHA